MTNDLDTTCFVIVGDWNANIRNGGESTFARHMSQLCMDNSYILSSQALLPTDSYTHVSEAWGSVSWLDHIVSSADFHHCIQTVSIDYDITDVDHIPVLMDISLDDIPETSVSNHVSYRRLSWDKLTADDRAKYLEVYHGLLSRIEIPDAVHCADVNCCDASHINTLTAKDGDLRFSAPNACLPKTEISVFVTECVFFSSTCYELHMFTVHDMIYG